MGVYFKREKQRKKFNLKRTLDLTCIKLEKRCTTINQDTPIPWNYFKDMIKLSIDEGNCVMFNKKCYKQIDGLTIGGSVS